MFGFFASFKNYVAKCKMEAALAKEKEREAFVSGEAIYALRKMEASALRCFGSTGFYNEDVNALLIQIKDEHMSRFLIRQLNYVSDTGTTIEYGDIEAIEERNAMMSRLLTLYMMRFKDVFLKMSKNERNVFFQKMKEFQSPQILVKTIEDFEGKLNKITASDKKVNTM